MQTDKTYGNFYLGRLMSPAEVQYSTAERSAIPESVRSRWCLCGDIPDCMWEQFQSAHPNDFGYRVTAFRTESATVHAIFTVQVGASQVRFLYPLVDSHAGAFLGDASLQGCWFSLGQEHGGLALLNALSVSRTDLLPLLDLAKIGRRLSPEGTLLEIRQVTQAAMSINLVPSVFLEKRVRSVAVNIILPKLSSSTREGDIGPTDVNTEKKRAST